MYDDLRQRSLAGLYKLQKQKKQSLSRAMERNDKSCKCCQEIKNLEAQLEEIDYIIGALIEKKG